MQAHYEKQAREYRAQGAEESQRIKANADKEQKVIIAEAQRNSQITRGEGDAEAASIAANAYSKDAEFFDFYKTMEVYRTTLKKDDTKLLLSPDSKFFKFFNGN